MNSKKEIFKNFETRSDEIDLKRIARTLKRGKFVVFSITTVFTLINIIYTGSLKKIYKGDFEVQVKKEETNKTSNLGGDNLFNLISKVDSNLKTQEYILKSPSLLRPVYNSIKDNYFKINGEVKYKTWVKKNLDIQFVKETSILKVIYKDTDKKLINEVLNKISQTYKDYSIREKEEDINKTIQYLKKQKDRYDSKSKKSLKAFNDFSIEHGLGDVDGFLINNNQTELLNPLIYQNPQNNPIGLNNESSLGDAGIRFQKQFALLEKYEMEYTDLSSRLKPNSKYLSALKLKIDNLRTSLKRPNEILIKYKELKKKSIRDTFYLDDIENKLIIYELEKAKQPKPWKSISEPMINDNKVFPNRSTSALRTFILSIFLSSIFVIYKEKNTGIIFEIDDIEGKLNFKKLGNIYVYDEIISSRILKKIISSVTNNAASKESICIIDKSNYPINNISFNKNINIIKSPDIKEKDFLEGNQKIIFLIGEGIIDYKDLIYLNEYNEIYKDKIIGWIAVEKDLKLENS